MTPGYLPDDRPLPGGADDVRREDAARHTPDPRTQELDDEHPGPVRRLVADRCRRPRPDRPRRPSRPRPRAGHEPHGPARGRPHPGPVPRPQRRGPGVDAAHRLGVRARPGPRAGRCRRARRPRLRRHRHGRHAHVRRAGDRPDGQPAPLLPLRRPRPGPPDDAAPARPAAVRPGARRGRGRAPRTAPARVPAAVQHGPQDGLLVRLGLGTGPADRGPLAARDGGALDGGPPRRRPAARHASTPTGPAASRCTSTIERSGLPGRRRAAHRARPRSPAPTSP